MNSLEDWVEKLKDSNKLIIVEGKKDRKALKDLGISKIITISSSPLLDIEKISEKEVIILTDLDRHGKKLYSKLRHTLQRRGIKINKQFREFLFRSTRISHIEGIKIP